MNKISAKQLQFQIYTKAEKNARSIFIE